MKDAIRARRQGKNVAMNRRCNSRKVECGAFPGEKQQKDKGHKLPSGKRGHPHYQTKDRWGHTFWGYCALIGMKVGDFVDPGLGRFNPEPVSDDYIPRTENLEQ